MIGWQTWILSCWELDIFLVLSILELCSVLQQVPWKHVDSVRAYFWILLSGIGAAFSPGLIFPQYQGYAFLCTPLNALWIMRLLHFSSREYELISALYEFQWFSPLLLLLSFIPYVGQFLTCLCWSVLNWRLKEDSASLCHSLTLSSLVSSSLFGFPSLPFWILLDIIGLSSSCAAACKLCQGSELEQSQGSPWFLSLSDHFSVLPDIQCPKLLLPNSIMQYTQVTNLHMDPQV